MTSSALSRDNHQTARLSSFRRRRYCHVRHDQVPGRLRLAVRGLRQSPGVQLRLEQELGRQSGVDRVRASTLTGTLLILFVHPRSAGELIKEVDRIMADLVHQAATSAYRTVPGSLPRPAVTQFPLRGSKPVFCRQPNALVVELGSSEREGLSSESAANRLRKLGANRPEDVAQASPWQTFAHQFQNVPTALLSASAALSLFTGGTIDALMIMGVVVVNGLVSFRTESKAAEIIASLSHSGRASVLVLRDGAKMEISCDNLVVGDIVFISAGVVPADLRILDCLHLTVDESALTGESAHVVKTADTLRERSVSIGRQRNMLFSGTVVTGGSATAVVVATGRRTEIGQVRDLVSHTVAPPTPLEKDLEHLSNQIVKTATGICVGVFCVGLMRGLGAGTMLRSAVSLAVAAIPEGLPTIGTTTLAIGVWRMQKNRAIVQTIEAVDSIGTVEYLCLDKTGTLTKNSMDVVGIHCGLRRVRVQEGRFYLGDSEIKASDFRDIQKVCETVALCSDAEYKTEGRQEHLAGSPTETALLRLAEAGGLTVQTLRKRFPKVAVAYRNEASLFMSTVHQPDGGRRVQAVKGNPEQVLRNCQWYMEDGETKGLAPEIRQIILDENQKSGRRALRVLGVAYQEYAEGSIPEQGPWIWLGLVALRDPPRTGARELLEKFQRAGIKPIMMTGDQPETATALARELAFNDGKPLTSRSFRALSQRTESAVDALVADTHVFSQVSPADKLRIVQSLQRQHKTVAMTGDGINDSPALKAADIGIAMGEHGSEAAVRTADIVLADDNLQTIYLAVEQGRTIRVNLRKAMHYLLSTNLSEIVTTLTSLAVGLGHPLSPLQLLWLNSVTDLLPALALALEPAEASVMEKRPSDLSRALLEREDLQRIVRESLALSAGTLLAQAYGVRRYGIGTRASSMAFATLILAQLLHVYSARSEGQSVLRRHGIRNNPYVFGSVAIGLCLQAAAYSVPGLQRALQFEALGIKDAAVVLFGAIGPLAFNEAMKPRRHRTKYSDHGATTPNT